MMIGRESHFQVDSEAVCVKPEYRLEQTGTNCGILPSN
jgi:hypothetical protein